MDFPTTKLSNGVKMPQIIGFFNTKYTKRTKKHEILKSFVIFAYFVFFVFKNKSANGFFYSICPES